MNLTREGLSIVVPAFNEEKYLADLIRRVVEATQTLQPNVEIVIVDDGSSDCTWEVASGLASPCVHPFRLAVNSGKGAAVQFGISKSTLRHVIIQDADHEYDPNEIVGLYTVAVSLSTGAVYGSRILGARNFGRGLKSIFGIWPKQGLPQRIANMMLSLFFLIRHGRRVTDLLTGYKVYPRSLFDNWAPESKGFETDHEISVKLVKLGIDIIEIPVHYSPRSKAEGKKIEIKDFFKASNVILRK